MDIQEKPALFDTDEKKASAVSAFLSLLQHPGWQLLEQMLDIDIEFLRDQLESEGGEGETKGDVDLIRKQLRFYKEHRNKPKQMIEKLQAPPDQVPNDDPYDTVESLKKARSEIA